MDVFFYNQMEFIIEPCHGITISTCDLLLITCSSHEITWIGCVFMDDYHRYYVIAVSKCILDCDLKPDDNAYRCNNDIQNITRSLFGGSYKDGKWRSIPQHLWPAIHEFVYGQVY